MTTSTPTRPGDDGALVAAHFVLGKKWVLQILAGAISGFSRFNEFIEENPGLSDRVLAARLRDLVHAGLLRKDGAGKSVRYSLTGLGTETRCLIETCVHIGSRAKGG